MHSLLRYITLSNNQRKNCILLPENVWLYKFEDPLNSITVLGVYTFLTQSWIKTTFVNLHD